MATPPPEITGYQLLKQIGSGGMATVFLAVQVSLDRKVAIKVLRTTGDDDPERTEKRFLREGRTLAKITHKNVCGIYDIAKVGNIAYIAMEYLDGGTLVDKLKQGVSVGESISIVVQVATALEEAHKLGIIHRDLKPANVMLRGRVPVLTDFGIARELTASQTRITAENMIVGTPIYMSPEQVSGGEVDGRSDLYALGIMFYELLTGQPPYKGETPIAVCMQHLTAALPQLPPDLADLQPVMDRMLAKKREDRYATMTQFTHALRDVFVASESMREVALLSPDTPWSEQLRELGFSFDTLRDADLKAALEAQRKRAGGKAASKTAPGLRRPVSEPGVSARRWPLYLAVVLLLALVGAGGGWWMLKPKPPTETESIALNALRQDFTERLAGDHLFEPAGKSALDAARQMREIHATAEQTVATEQALQRAIVERARTEVSRRDLIALDATLAAIASGLPGLPEFAQLTAERAALAAQLAGEAAMRSRLTRLAALLDGAAPDKGESVLGLYLDLRPALAADPEFKALEARAQASARVAIEAAMTGGDDVRALADAQRLLQVVPQDAALIALTEQLKASVASVEIKQRAEAWRLIFNEGPIDAARLAKLLSQLDALTKLGQPAADQAKMRQFLVDVLLADTEKLVVKGEHDSALALIGQALAGLGSVPALSEAQQRIGAAREQTAAAQRTANEQARLGQVAISAAPWARVDEVIDAAGVRVALPAEPTTPLLMTLPEGSYRITVSAPQGGAKRQEAVTVVRGKLATLSLRMPGYSADQYLREVRW